MGEEKSKVKIEPDGELAIGYEVSKARAWALEHAKRNLRYRMSGAEDLELAWEVLSARFDEDQDCYEVVVAVYPQEVPYQHKAEWVYHVNVQGELMPGTPILRTPLDLRQQEPSGPQEPPAPRDFPFPWPRRGGRRRGGC